MPPIPEVSVPFHGLHFLRPGLLIDFVTISANQLLAVPPVALLYSTVGVLQHAELRKLPIEASGLVVYPISPLKLPATRAKLMINAQSERPKFLEALLTNTPHENAHSMLGLALEFTVVNPA
ncbi:TPA: hypothetical protein ACG1RN_000110 [Klebsiella oxytoca]